MMVAYKNQYNIIGIIDQGCYYEPSYDRTGNLINADVKIEMPQVGSESLRKIMQEDQFSKNAPRKLDIIFKVLEAVNFMH